MFAQSVEEVSQEIHGFYCKMHMDKSLKGIDEELGKCSKKAKKSNAKKMFLITKSKISQASLEVELAMMHDA